MNRFAVRRSFPAHALLAAGTALGIAAPLAAQTTTRVSVDMYGLPASIGYFSFTGNLSSNGRYVTFGSNAPNLAPGDNNGTFDAFVHDRATGMTKRVSVSSTGAQANGASWPRAISTDGRFIMFRSVASNLVPGDTNGAYDIFLRDELLGLTTRVSVSSSGVQANVDVQSSAMTPDSAWVVFNSSASNLDPQKTTNFIAPFVHDVATGTTTALPLAQGGAQLDNLMYATSISSNARYLALDGFATNIVVGDTNQASDAFVHDRLLGTTVRVSLDSSGIQGNSDSFAGNLSDDGRYAVFSSSATNLVPGDTNAQSDVFLRDLQLGTTTRLSVNPSGVQGDHWSAEPSITPDGRYVAFSSWSTNLVPGDNNNMYDQFRIDRQTGALEVASTSTLGQFVPGTSNPRPTFMSDDGNVLLFSGGWAGIVPTQFYSNDTVFVRDLTVYAPVTTYCTAKLTSSGSRPELTTAGVPRSSGVGTFFVVAQGLLPNRPGAFLWSRTATSLPFGGGTLCVASPSTLASVQGSGTYSFAFSPSYIQAHALAPGDIVYGQFLSRDPGFAAPNNIGLTEAVQFVLIP